MSEYSIGTVITTASVRALASTTIKEVTDFLKKNYSKYKALNELSSSNDDLVASIAKIMQVKTLYSGSDRSVNLFDFFQKPKLMFEKNCIGTIEHVNELKDVGNILFKGTVGQGKSIFMRSLVIQDLINNNRIPIFIELKNISKSKGIIELIKENLSVWIGNDNEIFNLVLKSGRVSIFLDAFDEIDIDLTQEAFSDINKLSQNYNKLKIIVSSRPDTIITENPLFTVYSLRPYEREEQEGLINKLLSDPENIKLIVKAIHKSTHEVKSVLTTPLMVVLFIRQYHVGFSIPQHVSDFYNNIFDVVTFTHDRSKGIEKRKSFSSLSQDQLEVIFERFCFETFLTKKAVFTKDTFVDLLKKSIQKSNISNFTDFNNLIFDYTRFACLILQDGYNYTFIHKSIQEFYVASFIEGLPENLAEKVIVKKLSTGYLHSNYLEFLRVIKPYYYNKYFILNGFNNYSRSLNIEFNCDDENLSKFSETLYREDAGQDDEGLGDLNISNMNNAVIHILDNFVFQIPVDLEEKNLVNKNVIGWVLDGNVAEIKKLILLRKIYPDINKNRSVMKVWEEICNKYHYYVNEVEMIENSISDLDI